jgi:response regulator of citrate/malate metabolism
VLFKLSGFDVIGTANNGKIAIEKYEALTEKPDIILIDHRIPLKNGLETAKKIFNLDKNSKIIFTTADSNIKEEALSLGVIDFIEKPFLCERLIGSIHNALKMNSPSTLQN